MSKRKLDTHQECLAEFGIRFKKEIIANLDFWKSQDKDAAQNRAFAFELVLTELKNSAKSTGVPLQDIGIEDFNVPKIL
ncbi:MAG: hypothetical protein JXR18_14580 [Neptuniibacter sp.]